MRLSKTMVSVALAGLMAILAVAAATPLTASASPNGFTSVRSSPRWTTTIVAPAPNEVWVAGGDGNAQSFLGHLVNGTWTYSTLPGQPSANHLESSAPDDVWMAVWPGSRQRGQFQHYDGSTWSEVALPKIPGATSIVPVVTADAPGPDFYAGFSYYGLDGILAMSYARYDGSTWTLLGAPASLQIYRPTPDQLEFVDGVLVALVTSTDPATQFVLSYADGHWSDPVGVHDGLSTRELAHDWVVNSPTDIWLYGRSDDPENPQDNKAWCGHFNGTGLDSTPCVAGRAEGVHVAVALPDGRHIVSGWNRGINATFDLLDQPAQQTPIESIDLNQISDMAAEPGTGVVWALAGQTGVADTLIMRYGNAGDTRTYALTASGPSVVQQDDVATFTGTVDPVSSVAAERRVVLQVKTGTTWTRVTTKRAAADGTYRFDVQLSRAGTFTYRVKKAASGDIAAGFSNTLDITVLEPFNLTIKAPTQVAVGDKLVIKGKVTPLLARAAERGIELQAKSGTTWKTVTTDRTAADGSYRFAIATSQVGRTKYRVLKPASGIRDAAVSRKVTVTVS